MATGKPRQETPPRITLQAELDRRGIAIAGGASPFAYRRGQLLLARDDLEAARRSRHPSRPV